MSRAVSGFAIKGSEIEPMRNGAEMESNVVDREEVVRISPRVKNAVWFGLLSGLLATLWAICCSPAVPIGYEVQSPVLLSPFRLETLQKIAEADRRAKSTAIDRPRIVGLKLRQESAKEKWLTPKSSHTERVANTIIVEVWSHWPRPVSQEELQEWLKEISTPKKTVIANLPAQKAERWAAWRFAATQHYSEHADRLAQSEFAVSDSSSSTVARAVAEQGEGSEKESDLVTNDVASEAVPQINVAEHLDRKESARAIPWILGLDVVDSQSGPKAHGETKLASFVSGTSGRNEVQRNKQVVEQSKLDLESSRLAAIQERRSSEGFLELSGSPRLRPFAFPLPASYPLGGLVSGIFASLLAVWFMFWIDRAQASRLEQVMQVLHTNAVPVIGVFRSDDSSIPVRAISPKTVRPKPSFWRDANRITRATEWSALLWALAIAVRMVTDPMWCSLLIHQPLAAMSRMLWGMG